MPKDKVSYEEVVKANQEAFVHFTLHDFRVLVETKGIEFVIEQMDHSTYWTLHTWFQAKQPDNSKNVT